MIVLFPASLSIDDHYKLNMCSFGGVVQQTYTVVTCFYKTCAFLYVLLKSVQLELPFTIHTVGGG